MQSRQPQKFGVFVVGVASLTIVSAEARAQVPGFRLIGELGGTGHEIVLPTAIGPGSTVYGVNDYQRNTGNFRRAFVWSPAGGLSPLTGTPSSGTSSGAYALSRDGSVLVGVLGIAPGSSGPAAQVFRRVNNGPDELLPLAPGMETPEVRGISADGRVTVGFVNGYGGGGRAVTWTDAGVATELPTLPGTPFAQALGVSQDGSVVVGWSGRGYPSDNTPCRWVNGMAESLGLPPGCAWAWAAAVSADGGTVVGYGWTFGGGERAFKWTAAEGMVLLDTGFANAVSVSDDGRLIGGRIGSRSVVWRDGEPFRVQEDVLEPGAGIAPFTQLSGNVIISHDGRTIAGSEAVVAEPGHADYLAWAVVLPDWFTTLPPLFTPCGSADLGSQGGVTGADGVLDNNDFIVFIDLFFAADARADVGVQGGTAGADAVFDNNDFVVFIDRFFAGCG